MINDYKSNGNLQQQIENASRLIGKTATFSVIMDVVTAPEGFALSWANASGRNKVIKRWRVGEFSSGKKLYSGTFTVPDNFSGVTIYVYSNADATDAEIKVYGAKLELGSDQTIAHQKNGEWVLNEIPDYGEQLARCGRQLHKFDNNWRIRCVEILSDYIRFAIPLPQKMRATPSIVNANNLYVRDINVTSTGSGFTFAVEAFWGDMVLIRASKTAHGFSDAVLVVNNGAAFLTAEL